MDKVILIGCGAAAMWVYLRAVAYKPKVEEKTDPAGSPKLIKRDKVRRKPKAHGDLEAFKSEVAELKKAERT